MPSDMTKAPPEEPTTAHEEPDDATSAPGTARPERANHGLAAQPTAPSAISPSDPEASSAPTRLGLSADASPVAIERSRSRGVHRRRDPERYQILGEHGRGGLGCVSRAHDLDLDRDIAIKELISRGHSSEARFMREALLTARLEHPGIVPVYEAGRWPDGTPFYAMKLVGGRPLRDLIAERTTVAERIGLLHHVIAVADAIAYAHGRDIIHRDLKPANVIVGDFGETIVIDWGLAKDLTASEEPVLEAGPYRIHHDDQHDDGLTRTGAVLGTPTYMPPEQERGDHVDQRADVFAIGAMLWELCSLQKVPPTDRRLRHRLLRRAGIDADLITIIDKALAPDPSRRYPNAGALAADLKAFKSGARIAARSYSLLARLAHWTRRHRARALSLAGIIAISVIVAVLYVRNIATERDRADAARVDALHERSSAALERDRAQLSEAAMWLEKDPTHAREVLEANESRNPQRALLLSFAEDRSADHVLHVDSRIQTMEAAGVPLEVAIVTINGTLVRLDPDAGTLRTVDHNLSGQLVYQDGHWCYAVQPTVTEPTIILGCGELAPLGGLLRRPTGQLISIGDVLYALESGELYRLGRSQATLVGRRIRGFTGSDTISMICTEEGTLQIHRADAGIEVSRCAQNESSHPMATKGSYYAALRSPTELISNRGVTMLPSAVKGEYEVVLGDSGLIALGDFSGDAWIVRPGNVHAERLVQRTAHPTTVAAEGTLVAFGYSDGVVIVSDTATDQRWELTGHDASIIEVSLDNHKRRVISTASNEIRIWSLRPAPISIAAALPCTPFHIIATNIPGTLATDCSDGQVLIWGSDDEQAQRLHAHRDLAFGVVMHRGNVCTGGWDGQVICTPTSGGVSKQIQLGAERVKALIACHDKGLFIATAEGAIWRYDGRATLIYRHNIMPYRIATNADCTWLASVAYDGSLIVYDIPRGQIAFQQAHAHEGQITTVSFQNDIIFTTGMDGSIRQWGITDRLMLLEDTRTDGAITKFRKLSDGWVASVKERTLVVHSASLQSDFKLLLGHVISDITSSANERYIAIAALSEILVIDRQHRSIATAHMSAGDIGCLQFVTPTRLIACDTSALLSISIEHLRFSSITNTTGHHE